MRSIWSATTLNSLNIQRRKQNTSWRRNLPRLTCFASFASIICWEPNGYVSFLLDGDVAPHSQRHRQRDGDGVEDLREVHVEHQVHRPRVAQVGSVWNVISIIHRNCRAAVIINFFHTQASNPLCSAKFAGNFSVPCSTKSLLEDLR